MKVLTNLITDKIERVYILDKKKSLFRVSKLSWITIVIFGKRVTLPAFFGNLNYRKVGNLVLYILYESF